MSLSLPSWKSYGGINSSDKSNNISVNYLNANYFTLKKAYIGYFTISGELIVSDDSSFYSNIYVGGNMITKKDHIIYGNNTIQGEVYIGKTLEVYGNT